MARAKCPCASLIVAWLCLGGLVDVLVVVELLSQGYGRVIEWWWLPRPNDRVCCVSVLLGVAW